MNFNVFVIRILVCFILSVLIGLERQFRHRMVGLRTNVLVSIGAFMFMSCSFGVEVSDQTRIAAQVVSGIGFLGAGVILRDGSKVKGLNTAATLWCVSAIGVLTSAGLLKEACVGTFFVLLSNIILRIISKRIVDYLNNSKLELCIMYIKGLKDYESNIRRNIFINVDKFNLTVKSLERDLLEEDNITLKVYFLTYNVDKVERLIKELGNDININSINWEHFKYKDIDVEDEEDGAD